MKIKITGRPNHGVYGEPNGMQGRLKYGFRQIKGCEIVEESEDILIVPGASADLTEIQTDGKKIFWSHGCNWARGFENEDNTVLKHNYDNADIVVFQSEFAKNMTEKAFGKKQQKEYPFIYNAGVVHLPDNFISWKQGEEIKAVCASIWRAWKRLHSVERLVRLIASNGQKIHLSVIGKDPNDNCPFGFPKEGENYKIDYLGIMPLEQMIPIYHQSHIGLHLAFNDFSPSSVMEKMTAGLPVIVTNSGGSKDVVKNGSGMIINTDPFVDTSFPIHNEERLPKVDDDEFLYAFWEIMNHLSDYQQANKEWVLKEMNCVKQAEKFLTLQ